jgi:hypothetical protein
MDAERRLAPRIAFIASAEVLATDHAACRLQARISDLSVSGCYVDTVNPLPDGSPVEVRIFNNSQVFEAPAKVVYSHAHLGMGLEFREIQLSSQGVLRDWLQASA